jgi:signal transduction histidine kinase
VLRAAHDLSSLLTVVIGYCDQAIAQGDLSPVHKARAAAQKSIEVLREGFGREISRAAASVTDLCELALEMADLLRADFAERGISIHADVPADPVTARGDALALYRALLNLCMNARNAMQACEQRDRELRILVHKRIENQAVISVRDTGTGMHPAFLREIWQPQFSADLRHGHGLQIVKKTVDEYGGRIEIESALGRGTEVTITLPAQVA